MTKSNWIRVEDKLPEIKPYRFIYLLVAKENGVVLEAMFNTKTQKFVGTNFDDLSCPVTHWQPLPEPPE